MWCELREKKEKKEYKIPCCVAGATQATQQILRVTIGGIIVGLFMLNSIFEKIASLNLSSDEQVQRNLLRQVRTYNYLPRPVGDAYAEAIMKKYRKGV